jgi:ABC-type sugar transport system ATPase subunit
MRSIRKTFPGVIALKNVSFDLRQGEVHALIGENGAGKSTLIKILGYIYTPDSGEILIDGKRVTIRNVHDARRNGISIIHQELVLVPEMTVAENIYLGREFGKTGFVDQKQMIAAARKELDFFDLDIDPMSRISELTIAQQQMVEIAKAVSYNARILVMDEPTSSISSKEVETLFSNIRKLKERGVGIIYISHRMSELGQVSDRITVLRDGEYIGTVDADKSDDDTLISMMVGRKITNYYTRTYSMNKNTVMEVKNLNDGKYLKDISFSLYSGEILGFSGLIGAGRSELMHCLWGIRPFVSGEITINGEPVSNIADPSDAMKHEIALVPEDRKKQGLFLQSSVRFNISIKVLDEFIKGFFVNWKKESQIVQQYIDTMSIRTPSQTQLVANLSGGNQQKVVIGRWLAVKPKILILDEPTRGIDVGAKAEIYEIMDRLTHNGVSIIMISSELPEIVNMSDRVVVMCNGRITGILPKDEVSQERIMQLATEH